MISHPTINRQTKTLILKIHQSNIHMYTTPPPAPFEQEPSNLNNFSTPDNRPMSPKKTSLSLKIVFIALITLVLLIPDAIIYSLNSDREHAQESTTEQISRSWSGYQTISGPIISIPYVVPNTKDSTGVIRLLPSQLKVTGDVTSQKLARNIYETVVYNADVNISGDFALDILKQNGIPTSALKLDKAYVTLGIGDLKGLESASPLRLGNEEYRLNGTSDTQVYLNTSCSSDDDTPYITDFENSSRANTNGCMQAKIALPATDSVSMPFAITLKIKGSESLSVTPIGGENTITISGECSTPSFCGMFLPSKRSVENGKFSATWNLNSNNREYQQTFIGNNAQKIANSAVSVKMLVPVDRYQKVSRSLKYALIVILLTFIAVLFAEVISNHPIHIFQYLLIGLALMLFYSLLLSLSEHMKFGLAYLIAATMTIGLVGCYMKGVIKSNKIALTLSALLAVIYLFIYILLCLETFALLTGSIGLFIALAAIMYASLRINNGTAFTK